MARFDPQLHESLRFYLDGGERMFSPVEHPQAPSIVHSMEGGKALVYRLRDLQVGSEYAFKVMRVKHRDPALIDTCAFLDRLRSRPGLAVCERLCLSTSRAAPTIAEYPSLEYAILMPWISGTSWYDALQRRDALDQAKCLKLAANLADVLASLEAEGIAHCDLSSGNLLFDRMTARIELIDVEDLYSRDAPQPKALPAGTGGYQHRTSSQGQWSVLGDRFAGALLLSEILGWYDPKVRAESSGDSFFDPGEVQQNGCARFSLLSAAVRRQQSYLGDLLAQAWQSQTLADCPSLATWSQACRSQGSHAVTWKPLAIPAATIGSAIQPFWKPLSAPGSNQGPIVQWKKGGTSAVPGGPTVTWKGGTGGGQ